RGLAVRGAVPGAEPDAAADHPRRGGESAGVGDLPRLQPGPGPAAVGRGGAALPPGEAGDLHLRHRHPPAETEKARRLPGLSFGLVPRAYSFGVKARVRRVVTGASIGSYFQRRTAFIASRSKTRGGLERTTRTSVTSPLVPTVNSTSTSPEVPARRASGG